jgi:hypothetical protein
MRSVGNGVFVHRATELNPELFISDGVDGALVIQAVRLAAVIAPAVRERSAVSGEAFVGGCHWMAPVAKSYSVTRDIGGD